MIRKFCSGHFKFDLSKRHADGMSRRMLVISFGQISCPRQTFWVKKNSWVLFIY